jgi:hypothetical protein
VKGTQSGHSGHGDKNDDGKYYVQERFSRGPNLNNEAIYVEA